MRIATLTPDTAELWFRAVGATPAPADLARVRALVAGGLLAPDLRLVAEDASGACARFAAQRRGNAIRFWLPSFRPGLGRETRAAAMTRFLDDLVARRAGATLETQTGEDEVDHALWMDILRRAGGREACCYRLHVLPRSHMPQAARARPGVAIRDYGDAEKAMLAGLYRNSYADTLDRRDRNIERGEDYFAGLAQLGEGREPGLWLIATVDGSPSGFAIVNCAREEAFPGMSAWILEIGTLPERRGRGLAGALLGEALARIKSAGCKRALATIDEQNTPSLRLHAAFGFTPQRDRHFVMRLGA
jgi:GNAT superfamily N-acetyltransferase